jgi:uncharacterized protein YpbB
VTDYRREHGIDKVSLPEPAAIAPPEKIDPKPKVKKDTRNVSLELLAQGLTISQIAARRGLALATIEGHFAFLVSKGEMEIGRVLADEKRRTIEEKIVGMHSKSLKELKAILGDDCSYGEIKLALAHLKYMEEQ